MGKAVPLLLVPVLLFLSFKLHLLIRFPYPPLTDLIYDTGREFEKIASYERPLGSEGGFRDFFGVVLGMRRLTADLAWISVLQYYGSHELTHLKGSFHEDHKDFEGGNYPLLKKMILRVTRIDPTLYYAYLYGSGSLAYNLNRPDQALEILEEAIRYNPTYWRFRLYVAAIIYKQKGQYDDMVRLLEDAIRYPDCPTLVKSVLAGIYEIRMKNYKRALEIWLDIAESERVDPTYLEKAPKKIRELREKLGI